MTAKILIVEDEVLIAEYIRDMLLEEGLKIIDLAHNSEDAREKMKSYNPDIILMDINLNGINSGIELAKEKSSDASIIFLPTTLDYHLSDHLHDLLHIWLLHHEGLSIGFGFIWMRFAEAPD